MYSFSTNAGRKKSRQTIRLLSVIIFILIIAVVGLAVSYVRTSGEGEATSSALMARAVSEASEAQSAVYRLTQSSGTNTMSLLSTVRSHIYALQCINTIASNIYGAGTELVAGNLLTDCINTISQTESRMQAGSVLTDTLTLLRDQVDLVVTSFSGAV